MPIFFSGGAQLLYIRGPRLPNNILQMAQGKHSDILWGTYLHPGFPYKDVVISLVNIIGVWKNESAGMEIAQTCHLHGEPYKKNLCFLLKKS